MTLQPGPPSLWPAYARAALPRAQHTIAALTLLRGPTAERRQLQSWLSEYMLLLPLYERVAAAKNQPPARLAALVKTLQGEERALDARARVLRISGCAPSVARG